MSNQGDMLGVDDADQDSILKHLSDATPEQKNHWPLALVELIDVLKFSRIKSGENKTEAEKQSIELALDISGHFGGSQFYLPKPNHLEKFVRDIKLFGEFNGNNIKELARKYSLTEVQVYSIIREQRQLHINKVQPDIFKK